MGLGLAACWRLAGSSARRRLPRRRRDILGAARRWLVGWLLAGCKCALLTCLLLLLLLVSVYSAGFISCFLAESWLLALEMHLELHRHDDVVSGRLSVAVCSCLLIPRRRLSVAAQQNNRGGAATSTHNGISSEWSKDAECAGVNHVTNARLGNRFAWFRTRHCAPLQQRGGACEKHWIGSGHTRWNGVDRPRDRHATLQRLALA